VKLLLILILTINISFVFSNNKQTIILNDSTNWNSFSNIYTDSVSKKDVKIRYFSKERFITIALIVLTGPLGGHRIYLGTHPVVPVFYALTLGGGFVVLPLIDLISIIFTKDLSKFENNERVIMWLNADKKEKEDEIKNR